VAFGGKAVGLADAVAQFDQFWDLDLDGFAGIEPDDQILGARAVGELVAGLVAVGEHALDDARIEHELDGAVDGCFGDSEAAGTDLVEQAVGLEQFINLDDGVQHAGSLGGVLEALGLEFAAEDCAQWLDDLHLVVLTMVFGARGRELHAGSVRVRNRPVP
jgi:hypothetical protein